MDDKTKIIRFLNHCENNSCKPETEYNKIYLYFDGPKDIRQVTLARGYTECGGALWKVFEKYKQSGGEYGDRLLSYKSQSGKQTLPYNKEFLKLIVDLGTTDELFKSAQDKVFDELYWNKGLKVFNDGNFKLTLSLAVIQDSILHSGSILSFLTNRFKEPKPSNGGDEKTWISEYCQARYNWLANGKGYLPNTAFRPKFFLNQIKTNNWDFSGPIVLRGVKIFS